MQLSAQQMRQIHWMNLLLPMKDKPGEERKKETKIIGRKTSHGNVCYLSIKQIKKIIDFMLEHEKLGSKKSGRKIIYNELLETGMLTDKNGRIMSVNTFGVYYVVTNTRKNSDDETTIRHCLKYKISAEVIAAVLGGDIKRQTAYSMIEKVKRELEK